MELVEPEPEPEALPELLTDAGTLLLLAATISLALGAAVHAAVDQPPNDAPRIPQYLAFEFFDVFTDVCGYWLVSQAGDLEFANDPSGLVRVGLLASVGVSALSFLVELCLAALQRQDEFEERIPLLQSFHFGAEDSFQTLMYAAVAAGQASQKGGATTASVVGLVQALGLVVMKCCDMATTRLHTPRSQTRTAATVLVGALVVLLVGALVRIGSDDEHSVGFDCTRNNPCLNGGNCTAIMSIGLQQTTQCRCGGNFGGRNCDRCSDDFSGASCQLGPAYIITGSARNPLNGRYERSAGTECNGKPVYEHSDGEYVLFQPTSNTGWMVGSQNSCARVGFLASPSGLCEATPDGDDCVGMWRKNTGDCGAAWCNATTLTVISGGLPPPPPPPLSSAYIISGSARNRINGRFERTANTCNGKPVYERLDPEDGQGYVLFQPDDTNGWMISTTNPTTCADSGIVDAPNGGCEATPEGGGCVGQWRESTDDCGNAESVWCDAPSFTVTGVPPPPPPPPTDTGSRTDTDCLSTESVDDTRAALSDSGCAECFDSMTWLVDGSCSHTSDTCWGGTQEKIDRFYRECDGTGNWEAHKVVFKAKAERCGCGGAATCMIIQYWGCMLSCICWWFFRG